MTSTTDRFGRSRADMRAISEQARGSICMDAFLENYDNFTTYTQTLKEPQLTGAEEDDAALLNAIGATSEMGEALDVVKKMYFHDRTRVGTHSPERMAKLKGELGDHRAGLPPLLGQVREPCRRRVASGSQCRDRTLLRCLASQGSMACDGRE